MGAAWTWRQGDLRSSRDTTRKVFVDPAIKHGKSKIVYRCRFEWEYHLELGDFQLQYVWLSEGMCGFNVFYYRFHMLLRFFCVCVQNGLKLLNV